MEKESYKKLRQATKKSAGTVDIIGFYSVEIQEDKGRLEEKIFSPLPSKSVCGQPHVGSNPTVSATSEQTLYRLLRRLFMPVAKETSFVRSPMPTVSKVRGAHSSPYHPAIILAGNTV